MTTNLTFSYLSQNEITKRAEQAVSNIDNWLSDMNMTGAELKVYGVSNGIAAYAFAEAYARSPSPTRVTIVDSPEDATLFVDDVIATGVTAKKYKKKYPHAQFIALVDKLFNEKDSKLGWVVFPWEDEKVSVENNVRKILQIGDPDPTREGIKETPARVARAWKDWTKGYTQNAEDILKTFEDGATGYDEMVVVKDIPLYSKCEHHLADIFGTATVAYIPNGKIVGLSKLSRLVDMHSRRLQVQERLTHDIAEDIHRILKPKGVGVLIKARHMCMESRGICQQGHHTVTSSLRGVIRDDARARAEYLAIAQ